MRRGGWQISCTCPEVVGSYVLGIPKHPGLQYTISLSRDHLEAAGHTVDDDA